MWINLSGVSVMVNASLPFIVASSNDSMHPPPEFRAYGFNTLPLPDNRTALLDAPMPNCVFTIQGNLTAGEIRTLKANVTATIAKYNSTPETHRSDDDFWNYYINDQFAGTGILTREICTMVTRYSFVE